MTEIVLKRLLYSSELTRIRIAGTGRGLAVRTKLAPGLTVIGRDPHGEITASSRMCIIELQEADLITGQYNTRRVDERGAGPHGEVIHTEHLVARVRINAPDIMRTGKHRLRRRSGVIPLYCNGISLHCLEGLLIRQHLRSREGLEVLYQYLALALAAVMTEEECIIGILQKVRHVSLLAGGCEGKVLLKGSKTLTRVGDKAIIPGSLCVVESPNCRSGVMRQALDNET